MDYGLNDYNYLVTETLDITGTSYVVPNKTIGGNLTHQNLYVSIPLYSGDENVELSLLYNRKAYTQVTSDYGKAVRLNYFIKYSVNQSGNAITCEFYDFKTIRYVYDTTSCKFVNNTTSSFVVLVNNIYYLCDKYGNIIELGSCSEYYPNKITYKDGTIISFTKVNNKLTEIKSNKNNLTIQFVGSTSVAEILISSDIFRDKKILISYNSSNYINSITHYINNQQIQNSEYLLNVVSVNDYVKLIDNTNKYYITIEFNDLFNVSKVTKHKIKDNLSILKEVTSIFYGTNPEGLVPKIINQNTCDYQKIYYPILQDRIYSTDNSYLEQKVSYVITNDTRITKYIYI